MSNQRPLPHRYVVRSTAMLAGVLAISTSNCEVLPAAPPAEFGGPGDQWSPETLFMASIASCFELSFRAIARASGLEWHELRCRAEGLLDRVEKSVRFTEVRLRAELTISDESQLEKADRLLAKAENACLISNSINAKVLLETKLEVVSDV